MPAPPTRHGATRRIVRHVASCRASWNTGTLSLSLSPSTRAAYMCICRWCLICDMMRAFDMRMGRMDGRTDRCKRGSPDAAAEPIFEPTERH